LQDLQTTKIFHKSGNIVFNQISSFLQVLKEPNEILVMTGL